MDWLFGKEIYKTPLQIQLVVTPRCNRSCPWCIEKENMRRKYVEDDARYLDSLCKLLMELNAGGTPYNIVVTGGEPAMNEVLVLQILACCQQLMPCVTTCQASDNQRKVRTFKLGINSNGDRASPIYRHGRLDYVDISFIDEMRDAGRYSKDKPVRLQTVYRASWFGGSVKEARRFISEAICRGYDSVLFRQLVGDDVDKRDIFEIERRVSRCSDFEYQGYQINVYDLWVKYKHQGHDVYFKSQNLDAQRVFERCNRDRVCSVIIWPDGRATKSWDYENVLELCGKVTA